MASPIADVAQGQLEGTVLTDLNGKSFFGFLGIPYAKPPVGELRFKAPVPAEPWSGVRDATKNGQRCYSRDDYTKLLDGSEDCLTVNVFTKELPPSSNKLKPVMVWIHGGAFTAGSNRTDIYGPNFLMIEDVVVVTINYRLGVLGFLSLEDTSLGVPGNAGLKDQALALKWVQENIKNFNGDPSNVTIFGESAGGVSVHYHVLSESSKGLFHKAILQSGCALNSWASGQRNVKEIAKLLGQEVDDEKKALDILKDTPVEKLYEAQEKYQELRRPSGRTPIGPVIEYPNETAFITRNPIDIITSGEYNNVPIMIGYNTKEGLLFEMYKIVAQRLGKPVSNDPPNLENTIPWQVNIERGSNASKLVCKKIADFYFKGPDKADDLYTLFSDCYFLAGIIGTVKNHLATTDSPIYLYRVSLEAGLNLLKNIFQMNHLSGVCHADELGYLFKNVSTPEIPPGSLEDTSVRRFVKLWTNFAKYGNPTPKQSELNITWKPVEKEEYTFLDIGKELTTHVNPEPERIALWREIFRLNPATEKFL